MFKALAFGIAAGAGFQAARNYPADGPVSAGALVLVLIVGVVAAYLGGRFHGRHSASAFASARAEANAAASASAQQQVNVAVVVPGQGAGAAPAGVRVPDESLPWFGSPRAQLSADDFDGMDVVELLSDPAAEGLPDG